MAATNHRLRRTVLLLVAALIVLVVTPIVTITLQPADFVPMAARLIAPWSTTTAASDAAAMPADPALTPDATGEALRRILGDNATSAHIEMLAADQVAMPSLDSMPAGVFADARDTARGGLDWQKVLIASRRRLSPAERAYLADIAASPLWVEWDKLARSPSVDILGSRVKLPFDEHAIVAELPLMRLTTLSDAGKLSAARAAHFLAIGRRDSAEAAVHATLSVGLLIDREAPTLLEAFMGRRLVYIASTLSNGLRGDTTVVALPRLHRDSTERTDAEARAVLVAVASDSTAHRGARFEALMNLSMVPCTNARELLFGFRNDVDGAFASARRNLIRQPSDTALLDLIERSSERSPDNHQSGVAAAVFRFMSHASSAILFNKRIHGCAEMLPYLSLM